MSGKGFSQERRIIYEDAVRAYLKKHDEIDDREKKNCEKKGWIFRGSIDWPEEDQKWKKEIIIKLNNMVIKAYVTQEEIQKIVDEIVNKNNNK